MDLQRPAGERSIAYHGVVAEAARNRMAYPGELLRRLGSVEVGPEVREKALGIDVSQCQGMIDSGLVARS